MYKDISDAMKYVKIAYYKEFSPELIKVLMGSLDFKDRKFYNY